MSSVRKVTTQSPESRLYLARADEAAKVLQLDLSGDRLRLKAPASSNPIPHGHHSSAASTAGAPAAGASPTANRLTIVPSVLQKYVNLKILDLSGNKLTSVQHLEKCAQLRSLDLSRNSLRIFPLRLMDNNQLTHLNLSGNFLSKIPRNVSLLAALVSLELSGNRLHNLPDIKHLKSLTHLRHLWIKVASIVVLGQFKADTH